MSGLLSKRFHNTVYIILLSEMPKRTVRSPPLTKTQHVEMNSAILFHNSPLPVTWFPSHR